MREKDQMLHFRVSKAELDIIRQKMQEVGVRNMGAYLRKMAMDGYCIRLDLGDLKKVVFLMRYASNNLNQYARKANETGSVYLEDIQDLQRSRNCLRSMPLFWSKKRACTRSTGSPEKKCGSIRRHSTIRRCSLTWIELVKGIIVHSRK